MIRKVVAWLILIFAGIGFVYWLNIIFGNTFWKILLEYLKILGIVGLITFIFVWAITVVFWD